MRRISELGPRDRDAVGAKATTLGELHALGVRVPEGFVVVAEELAHLAGGHPEQAAAGIIADCRQLDPTSGATFAVRSCAAGEDGAQESLAGRFQTFLDVAVAAVPAAAERVWRNCVEQSGVGCSVIVQRMIAASRAGVIFTVHPVSGNPGEAVIEVVSGLGDQLVGGRITPTRYVVDGVTGAWSERPGPQGARLVAAEIAELLDIGRTANAALGTATELEWAIANDELLVLQCRPITALEARSGPSRGAENVRYERRYESRNARPWYTVSSVGAFGSSLRDLAGFEYHDIVSVTDADMRTRGYHGVAELHRATDHFAGFWNDPDRRGSFFDRCDREFERARQRVARCRRMDWTALPTQALLTELRDGEALFAGLFATMVVTQPQHVAPLDTALRAEVVDDDDPEAAIAAVTRCGRPLPTDAEEIALARLREQLQRGMDDERMDRELDRLAERFGWIAAVESGAAYDREHYRTRVHLPAAARSDPAPVVTSEEAERIGRLIGELGNYRLWNRYHFMALRFVLQQIIDELVARSCVPALAYATVDELLDWHSTGSLDLGLIEARRTGYTAVLVGGRTAFLVGESASLLSRVAQGPDEPEVLTNRTGVQGDCACPGRAWGRVRVVSFVSDDYDAAVASFRPGEILVTGMTRPQIAHLCDRAAAIVTDEGGITCHAAVIGRESGIPTLVATHDATQVLRTGDLVYLDAQEGRLTILAEVP